jgi:hypothetical protein
MRHRKINPEQSSRRIGAMVRKELDWIFHDKISIVILFILPLSLILIVGNIQKELGPQTPPIIYIIDQDNSTFSEDYIQVFRNGNFSWEIHDSHSEPDNVTLTNAKALIPTTHLQAYIIIPANFSECLLTNRSANVLIYIDGINMLDMLYLKLETLAATMTYQITYQVFNGEILYVPELRPAINMTLIMQITPSIVPNVLFAVVNMIACQSIVADEPLKRMLLTPTRKFEVIIAKNIAYSFLGGILSFGCVSILWFVFDVPFISFVDAWIISFVSCLFGVSLGVFFSCLSTSRLQAAQLFLFAYIFQLLIVNNLRIEPIVYYMPIEIVRSVFVDVAYRGISLFEMGSQLAKIIGINVVVLVLSVMIYRLKKDDV